MLGLSTLAAVNSVGQAIGAGPLSSNPTPVAAWMQSALDLPGVNSQNPHGLEALIASLNRALADAVPMSSGLGATPYPYPRAVVPPFSSMSDDVFHWTASRLPDTGQVPIRDLRPHGPPPPPRASVNWRLLNRITFAIDLLSQSGHDGSSGQREFRQEVAVLPVVPGPRSTFYWNPPFNEPGFWNSPGCWSVGLPTSSIVNGQLFYTNVNRGLLIPGPGDPVVFDGALSGHNGLCIYAEPPSGSMCSSMLFSNGWNGTLRLTGPATVVTGTRIANLTIDASSAPTIICEIGDLNLARTCGIPHGNFRVSRARLIVAPDAVVTVGQITVFADTLYLGPAGKSTLVVSGSGISGATVTLTSPDSLLTIVSDATIVGTVINQGGTVQIGTPSGAGDDLTQYTLAVKYSPAVLSGRYYQDSGSLKLYNGSGLNLDSGFAMTGGTLATGYAAVGKRQSVITTGLGGGTNSIAATGIDFTGGTISPGSLDSNPYCNLDLYSSVGGPVTIRGNVTLNLPVNGQTPGTGAGLSSTGSTILITGNNTLVVTDGSGAGVITGSWTLIPGNLPTVAVTGNFTTRTVPDQASQAVINTGSAVVFQASGAAVATACTAISATSILTAVVTGSNGGDGSYTLVYDSARGLWQDSLTSIGGLAVTAPGGVFRFACGTKTATKWNLQPTNGIVTNLDSTSQPAGHGDVVFNNVGFLFPGATPATVTITI